MHLSPLSWRLYFVSKVLFPQDLDILMTVAGYPSITKDVNRKALQYQPYGVYPRGEHAKL